MAKIVTIHQPNYLPWIGLFSKIMKADSFIIYDNAQYTTNSVINRNKIRTNPGWCYLTIPIQKVHSFSKITEVTLPETVNWRKDHWQTIYQNYARTEYFKDHKDFFEGIYKTEDYKYLWQLNEAILLYLLKCFHIEVEIIRASELSLDSNLHQTEMLVACLKNVNASIYISGPSGKNYIETEKFQQNNIYLKYFKFQHPIYQQRYPGFEPNMSAIDLLFNMGPKANEIIHSAGDLEG
jgi:hypothetical protein